MQAWSRLGRPPNALGLLHGSPPACCIPARRRNSLQSAAQAIPEEPRTKVLLGIESSCDDTGAAVVTCEGRVLGEDIAGQADIHAPWGGVVPNLAMEAHKAAIDRVVDNALAQAGVQASQLDGVAVTVGPGLSLCLRVGVVKAMALAAEHRLPLVRVHHMEAHALVARLSDAYQPPSPSHLPPAALPLGPEPGSEEPSTQGSWAHSGGGSRQRLDGLAHSSVPFPFLCLLVSGGHNLVVLVQGVGQYVQLGTTVDDALGEAFDKVARLLSLDLRPSGGAALEQLAKEGNPHSFKFKVPMRKYNNANFSFAGLKTSVRMAIDTHINNAQPSSMPGAPLALPSSPPSTPSTPSTSTKDMQPGMQYQKHPSSPPAPSASADSLHDAQPGSPGGICDRPGDTPSTSDGDSLPSTSGRDTLRQVKADIAASFQHVATLHLVEKLGCAIKWAKESDPGLRHLVVAGGVACNQHIRGELLQLSAQEGLELVLPPPKWCTDNGVMVAWAGHERLALGLYEPPPEALALGDDDVWVDLKPRWPLTTEQHPAVAAAATAAAASSSARKRRRAGAATAPKTGAAVPSGDIAGSLIEHRGERKARLHTSLTEMTAEALAQQ